MLENLTPAQREAVLHTEGPLLILAGPGSGKTRVITHRIAHLLRSGVSPKEILALTFTNKAAEEMIARVQALVGETDLWMGTFHRFCARQLRRYAEYVGLEPNYTIYDTGDARQVLKRVLHAERIDANRYPADKLAGVISRAKSSLVRAEDFRPLGHDPLDVVAADVYPRYQQELLQSNAVDFDDLLLHIAWLLRENPELRASLDQRYRYVLVDEYQDTNLAQYAIARALSIDVPNLCVTGDPDQSIYGWRGANLGNILEFENDFPEVNVVRLEQNYRSTRSILHVAQQLITHNRRRKHKELYTENEQGQPVRLTAYPTHSDEAAGIAWQISEQIRAGGRRPRDFAVFYRTNALSRSIELALGQQGIPFQVVRGLEFFERKEIKDCLAWLHLLNNPRDNTAFNRVINTPPRGIGKKSLERLTNHARGKACCLLEAAREAGLVKSLPKRAAVKFAEFVSLYDALSSHVYEPVEAVLGHVLHQTGYETRLQQSGTREDEERLENIQELLSAAREFDEKYGEDTSLEGFLEQACLVSDTDAWEPVDDRVSLMTLHAAKGLEFPVVFVIAIEQGILPHEWNVEDPHRLEEERRLLFVGITRAQQELFLSTAQRREFRGRRGLTVPSKFLMELPREEMEVIAPQITAPRDEWNQQVGDEEALWQPPEVAEETIDVPAPRTSAPVLTTAAALAGEPSPGQATTTGLPVDAYYQGMAVMHPEYGPGKIVALSGSGRHRRATVMFPASGERKFVLAQSPLRPLGT